MKVSLPTNVPMRYVASFSLALLALELAEGTSLLVGLTAQAFIIVSALAFNVAGGLMYPSGAFVFFNAMLSLIVGAVVKTVLGEPLDSNLSAPEKTLLAYLAGMIFILLAVFLAARFRPKKGLLEQVDAGQRIDQIGIGCMLIAYATPYVIPGSLQGTFSQFNNAFVYLAILLPVYQRTKQTDGHKSFHYVALIGWIYLTYVYGIAGLSKQGLFGPSAAWIIAAVAAGYRISLARFALVASVAVFAIMILTPYSQLARNYRGEANQAEMAWQLLEHPLETRARYNEEQRVNYLVGQDYHWFDKPQGLLDRLTMVPVDDALIWTTDNVHAGSPYALWTYVLNMIPRYVYPNKPTLLWGNVYAREVGVIPDSDETTGISFTAYADGYHTAGWIGVTLILGLMVFAMCYVCDSIAGSLAKTQWGLVYVLYFSHAAAEGMLGMTTYAISNASVALICAALISTYLAPLLGGLVTFGRRAPQRA